MGEKMTEDEVEILEECAAQSGRNSALEDSAMRVWPLEDAGLIEERKSPFGYLCYYITEAGRRALAQEKRR